MKHIKNKVINISTQDGSILQNIETAIAGFIHGNGKPFEIIFKGVNKIGKNFK